ncbi:MAG: hypothetical protein EOP52_06565 [Sphingobacteriales bacterium]|nr:MAG: hypothetical protein EOP52_06565 [Sphingobacteriales bacterium]
MRIPFPFKCVGLLMSAGVVSGTASAQVLSTRENIPYSRYGIGDLLGGTSVAQRGGGSAAIAVSNPFAINTDNPASYAGLKMTTYEGAFTASRRSVATENQNFPTGTTTLSYLRVGLPVAKNAGVVFGLQPESRSFYHLSDTSYQPGLGYAYNQYIGSGGLSQAFLGGAVDVKGFRLGFNVGYTFGTFTYNRSREFYQQDTASSFGAEFDRTLSVGGLTYKLGAQYTTVLKGLLGLRLGATATLKQDLNAETNDLWLSYRFSGSSGTILDTAYASNGASGKMTLPMNIAAGMQLFYGNQWAISADFSTTSWKDYRVLGNRDSLADRAWRAAIGAEYTPSNTVGSRFLQRVTYRLGASYGTDPYFVGGAQPSTIMGTAGMSIPFRRTTDRVHLALEVGRRTSSAPFTLKETFTRFSVGLSLNDRWFVKRRYD